jgi:hypothetical protein
MIEEDTIIFRPIIRPMCDATFFSYLSLRCGGVRDARYCQTRGVTMMWCAGDAEQQTIAMSQTARRQFTALARRPGSVTDCQLYPSGEQSMELGKDRNS